MARRRKPGESADAPKPAKPSKPEAKRESKKPKSVVRDYVREYYGRS